MHGGKHHGPSVITHFFPGLLAGFVIGGIVGSIVIAHTASTSLHYYWEAMRQEKNANEVICADISGLRIQEEQSSTGNSLTSMQVGDGEETLLTVSRRQLRYVPSTKSTEAYFTAVASADQQEAFPATSLYHVDFCKKATSLVLGGGEGGTIYGISEKGTWAVYEGDAGVMVMNTDEHRALVGNTQDIPVEVQFSPTEQYLSVRYVDGQRELWDMSASGNTVQKEALTAGVSLPAWGVDTKEEYRESLR